LSRWTHAGSLIVAVSSTLSHDPPSRRTHCISQPVAQTDPDENDLHAGVQEASREALSPHSAAEKPTLAALTPTEARRAVFVQQAEVSIATLRRERAPLPLSAL
jgi:hypothetical protein